MKHYIQTIRAYAVAHRKKLFVVVIVAVCIAFVAAAFAYDYQQQTSYQPANACKMLTPRKAQELLGERVIRLNTDGPIVSGNIATSKCSYTNFNPNKDEMLVAAAAIRSAINDKGAKQNETEFIAATPDKNVESATVLEKKAFFNKKRGQLNILDGRNWIIVSFGVGVSPETNTLDDVKKLAKLILTKD